MKRPPSLRCNRALLLIGASSWLGLGLPSACATAAVPDTGLDMGGAEGSCEGEECETNSESCERDKDCDLGKICEEDRQVCVEEPSAEGSGGERATIQVREQGGAAPLNFGGGEGCIDVQVEFEPVIPTIVLLMDQSGSMNGGLGFGDLVEREIEAGEYQAWGCPLDVGDALDSPDQENPTWRWNVIRSVLFNPESGIVASLEEEVRFGMTLYTSRGGYGSGETSNECPVLSEVEVRLENAENMLATMDCSDIGADTPTRESLAQTVAALNDLAATGPKMIVIATDGEPDSCECPSYGENEAEACQPSTRVQRDDETQSLSPDLAEQYDLVQESKRSFEELGITVSVIDVSSPDNTSFRQHLREVAEVGGGELYDGTRPTGLLESFQSVVNGIRSCAFDLDGEISEGHESSGFITLDGDELSFSSDSEGDGFVVNSSSQIELIGDACDQLKEGGRDLRIQFPCDSFMPVLR